MTDQELVDALKELRPRTRRFNLVRAELNRQGRWKNLSRGKYQKQKHKDRT